MEVVGHSDMITNHTLYAFRTHMLKTSFSVVSLKLRLHGTRQAARLRRDSRAAKIET